MTTPAKQALEALDKTVMLIKDKHEFTYAALDLIVEHGMTIRTALQQAEKVDGLVDVLKRLYRDIKIHEPSWTSYYVEEAISTFKAGRE